MANSATKDGPEIETDVLLVVFSLAYYSLAQSIVVSSQEAL